jgi:predicted GNAT superfamily acetyltransferase
MAIDITFRRLNTLEEYHACEALQRRVWAMPDDMEVVPLHMLMPIQRHGGLLLGAFEGEELVGFVFGYLGRTETGRFKHCSHMMGVLPGYQGSGIGYRLKVAQAAFALDQGYDLVTWTYDPLQSRNAYLNIHKLGAVCQTYIADFYGPMIDGLNVGLPSDRFEVAWWIDSARVVRRLAGQPPVPDLAGAMAVNAVERTAAGLLAPGALTLDAGEDVLRVEIPADYGAIKTADPALAMAWRLATRELFETYFGGGYVVVDFVSEREGKGRRSYYLLEREWRKEIGAVLKT